jgi:carbamoyltransferase
MSRPRRVVGISAYYHDSAAALVEDGRVVAAAQEERFTRKKHDAAFPSRALAWILDDAGIGLEDVDRIVFYEKPFIKFERLLSTYVGFAPRGFRSFRAAMPRWFRERLFLRSLLGRELSAVDGGFSPETLGFAEHHQSHAASAFFASPFDRAAVLTMDGVGEWATTTIATGRGRELDLHAEITFPHSLGMLYSAFTQYLGFVVNSDEYKVMGLAPYGEPRFADVIREHVLDLKPDGSFRMNMDLFEYCTGLTMINDRFEALFGGPARTPEGPLEQRHADLAASVQRVLEDAVLRLAAHATERTGERALCLAGGVALNCVANGRVLRESPIDRLFIQPAAGDAGGALGAALAGYHLALQADRPTPTADAMAGAYLGPGFDQRDVERRFDALGVHYDVLDEEGLLARTVDALVAGRIVGWLNGRMEFGPRALGARSILGDPRVPDMQARLNEAVKHRETFRPFAPAVLAEHAPEWFDLDVPSPYMLLVAEVAESRLGPPSPAVSGLAGLGVPRSTIPAVTHVDGSARVQTVHADTNPRFHALLEAFRERTGCPVLVNTSFNVRGEPIVCTPEDAYRCFSGTAIDVLAAERCFVDKAQ